jgi:drug/metabolite transporter (DMT)-like permease
MSRLDHKTKGAALIFIACGFYCISGSLIKAGAYIGMSQLVFFRFVIGLILIVAAARSMRIKLVFNDKKLLFLRGLTGGIAVCIAVLSVIHLGLTKGMILCSSYPVFTCIFGAIFLKEHLRAINYAALFIAMVGVYLVAYEKGQGLTLLVLGKYELLALCGAISSGIAITLVRKLHDTDSSLVIYFAQCAVGLWLVIVPAIQGGIDFGFKSMIIVTGMAVAITIGQVIMTEGFKYVPVKIGSLLLLLEPVLCYIAGLVVFHEPVTLTSISGSLLIIGSCVMVLAGSNA